MMEFVFEETLWEQTLNCLRPGDEITMLKLLSCLEEEDEETVLEALNAFAQKGVSLSIAALPIRVEGIFFKVFP